LGQLAQAFAGHAAVQRCGQVDLANNVCTILGVAGLIVAVGCAVVLFRPTGDQADT
jgi:hypothetical protein